MKKMTALSPIHDALQDEVHKFLLINPAHDMDDTRMLIENAYPGTSEIWVAESFDKGLNILGSRSFSFVIFDVALAEEKGVQSIHEIKRVSTGAPILVFTAEGATRSPIQYIQAGAQDYMLKGKGDHFTLRRIIQYSLERSRFQKQLQEANIRLEAKIRERTVELEKALELAHELSEAKTNLFTNLTHELRTPLHAILNFSEFAREKYGKAPDEKILGYIEKINKSGNRLLNLVNDILDLSKLHAEKERAIDAEEADLRELADEAIGDLQSLSDKRGITVMGRYLTEDTCLLCDKHKITQVIVNLLSNAYKFTPEGSTVQVVVEAGESDMLRLAVLDEGAGIPEEELKTIFDEFSQSQKVKSGVFNKGTGLGLAICKQILNYHHGRIWAENRREGGARLEFEIPRNLGEKT